MRWDITGYLRAGCIHGPVELAILQFQQMGTFVSGNNKLLDIKYFHFGGAETRTNAKLFSA